MSKIIGRQAEIKILEMILSSKQAELVAVYGRRRIGKTYLIHQLFSKKGVYLECSGLKNGTMHDQLTNFVLMIQKEFYPNISLERPKSWKEAFTLLTKQFEMIPNKKKIILFLDELPWLATKKSKFLQEFDYFWNTVWSRMANLKIILCGSAASWMLDNLIHAKGGLYNRITKTIRLDPFTLGETKALLESNGFKLTHQQVLELYMVLGGVPFYINQLQKDKSISQNINDLCFTETGLLYSEFDRLFKSLFSAYEENLSIVKQIAQYRYGIGMSDLTNKLGKKPGGRFGERLHELEAAGFVQRQMPFGRKQRDSIYKIIDEYTLFYFQWINEVIGKIPKNTNYWHQISKSSSWQAWSGFSFEMICFKHIDKIIQALKLEQMGCLISTWKFIPKQGEKKQGAQIDLLLDRNDNAITICEIKYNSSLFSIDKNYAKNLANKIEIFEKESKTPKQVFLAMVTASGLKKNIWSEDLVHQSVELKDFF